ncbi:MAG: Fur family transcriptional regulator [Canibacter sp.]
MNTTTHPAASAAQASQEELRSSLQSAGLRVTGPRLTALQVLRQGGHLSAERVFAQVRDSLAGTSLQTVYGVLEALCATGLARKIELAGGGAALFEANKHDNHHHLVCRICGRVNDVPCDLGEAPCLHPPTDSGFEIDEADVTFYGLCGDCREAH